MFEKHEFRSGDTVLYTRESKPFSVGDMGTVSLDGAKHNRNGEIIGSDTVFVSHENHLGNFSLSSSFSSFFVKDSIRFAEAVEIQAEIEKRFTAYQQHSWNGDPDQGKRRYNQDVLDSFVKLAKGCKDPRGFAFDFHEDDLVEDFGDNPWNLYQDDALYVKHGVKAAEALLDRCYAALLSDGDFYRKVAMPESNRLEKIIQDLKPGSEIKKRDQERSDSAFTKGAIPFIQNLSQAFGDPDAADVHRVTHKIGPALQKYYANMAFETVHNAKHASSTPGV